MQPSAAERTANVQTVGAAVSTARRISLPKVAELTQLGIKVPSVNVRTIRCTASYGTRSPPQKLPARGRINYHIFSQK
jgi:hypothetical protein